MNWLRWLPWLLASRLPLGPRGERLAAKHLKSQGYHLLARNLRCRAGEIDLLVETPDRQTLVLVEVKSGSARPNSPRPEIHVDRRKQRKLTALAAYLRKRNGPKHDRRPIRFDVIAVDFGQGAPVLRHHQAYFQSPWFW